MFCVKCGNELSAKSKFCKQCGNVVKHRAKTDPQSNRYVTSVPQPYARINKNSRFKKSAVLAMVVAAVVVIAIGVLIFRGRTGPNYTVDLGFDISSFEVFSAIEDTVTVFYTANRVESLSGIIDGDIDGIESFHINTSVGNLRLGGSELRLSRDAGSSSLNWRYDNPILLPSYNTITARAVLKNGNVITSSVQLVSDSSENHNAAMLDTNDDDGDGLLNWEEIALGTNPNNPDTDGDGLTDWEEVYITFTNPLVYDTFNLGMSDAEADFDNDGISNIDEIRLFRTDPLSSDTDGDGLSDYEEVFVYRTNPLAADTDGDGADDGSEVRLDFDPLVFNSSFTPTIGNGEPNRFLPVTASVAANLDGWQLESLNLQPVSPVDNMMLAPTIPGYLGLAYEFSVDGGVHWAEVTFSYDEGLGIIGSDFQPRVYYFEGVTGDLVELPDQTVRNGSITADVSQLGEFILLNSVDFDAVWDFSIRPLTAEGEQDLIDLIFVIDESRSMEGMQPREAPNNDPDRIRVLASLNLSYSFLPGDRVGVVGFNNTARLRTGLTGDMDVVRAAINAISGNMSGTATHLGITRALNELRDNGRPNSRKIIIALTDGEDTWLNLNAYDTVITRANNENVTIYTIGLGPELNELLLDRVAHQTGGEYFHAQTAEQIYEWFEFIGVEAINVFDLEDSNGDGIPDYYSRLIFEGKLRLQNGSAELMGTDFSSNPDMDGDGLLNGQEIEIVQKNDRIFIRMLSHPLLPDSDFDGVSDYDEVMNGTRPLVPEYFSLSDVDTLMRSSDYEYSKYTHNYAPNDWSIFRDALYGTLAGVNVQQNYTMEMAEFFAGSINQDYFEYLMMLEMKKDAIDFAWLYVAGMVNTTVADIEQNGFNDDRVAEAGGRIRGVLTDIDSSITVSSIDGFEELFIKTFFNEQSIELAGSVGVVATLLSYEVLDLISEVTKILPESVTLIGGVITSTYEVVKDIVETTNDSQRMWGLARAFSHDKTTGNVIRENMDLLNELKRSPRIETRRAAQFIQDAYDNQMQSAWLLQVEMIASQGLNTALDVMGGALGVASAICPPLLAVTVPLAVLGVVDTILGRSDNIATRAQFFVISDMTDATNHLIGRVYFRDEAKLHRHLTNLANLRITGETRFVGLRGTGSGSAQQNINRVNAIAAREGLPIFPR